MLTIRAVVLRHGPGAMSAGALPSALSLTAACRNDGNAVPLCATICAAAPMRHQRCFTTTRVALFSAEDGGRNSSESNIFKSPYEDMVLPEDNLWNVISQRWITDPQLAARPALM